MEDKQRGVCKRWTVQMKYGISGCMRPAADTEKPSFFYVSDGLFSTISGMRFRKMSIETGEELANVLTRDGTRCIYFDGEYIYAFLSRRILKLYRNDLKIAKTYKERIPYCADYVAYAGNDTFLLGNHNADSMSLFNVETKQTRRKKIGGCCGIFKTEQHNFLIFNYDSILEYSLAQNKLAKIADTPKYTKCVMGKSRRAYLLCGGVNYSGPEITSAEYKIPVYSFSPEAALEKNISIPQEICSRLRSTLTFSLSEDEELLYLYDTNTVWIYSVPKDAIIFQNTFPFEESIQNVFTDRSFVITLRRLQGERDFIYKLSGWEMDI